MRSGKNDLIGTMNKPIDKNLIAILMAAGCWIAAK